MPRIRLLHTIPRIAVSSTVPIGGSAVSLLSLINAQRNLPEYRVGLLAGAGQTDGPVREIVSADVQTYTFQIQGRPASQRYGVEFLMRSFLQAPGWVKDLDPTIIHGHSGRWHYAVTTYLLARRLRRNWIHTLYCPVLDTKRLASLYGRIIRHALADAAAVTCISKNVVRSAERAGIPTDRLHHIDPCVDITRYRRSGEVERTRQWLELPSGARVILFVGNAAFSKGFDILWEAFKTVRRRIPEVYLVATFELHGTPYKEAMTRQVDQEHHAHVRPLGIVDNMPRLLEAADVLVIPFRNTDTVSDYPLPMLEAMAIGTPVIASNIGGIPELLTNRETGLLVPSEDSASLARALQESLGGGISLERLADAAQTLVFERCSPDVVVKQWDELYGQVL